jgi:anti-anti-sigma factor
VYHIGRWYYYRVPTFIFHPKINMTTLKHYAVSNMSAVIVIAGGMDTQGCREIEPALWGIIQEYPGLNIVVDLADVNYLSSYAIGCLVEACGTVTGQGGLLSLAKPQPQVYESLYLNGADLLIPIYESWQIALAESQIRHSRRYPGNRDALA